MEGSMPQADVAPKGSGGFAAGSSLSRGLDSPEHGRQGKDRWGRPVSVRNRSHEEENKPQPANTPLCFGNGISQHAANEKSASQEAQIL